MKMSKYRYTAEEALALIDDDTDLVNLCAGDLEDAESDDGDVEADYISATGRAQPRLMVYHWNPHSTRISKILSKLTYIVYTLHYSRLKRFRSNQVQSTHRTLECVNGIIVKSVHQKKKQHLMIFMKALLTTIIGQC